MPGSGTVTNFQIFKRGDGTFYNRRGTAEQWIKEGKQAVAMTRLSCHRFRANQARLRLSLISDQLQLDQGDHPGVRALLYSLYCERHTM